MSTLQSAAPCPALRDLVRAYAQRTTGATEVPVVQRVPASLEVVLGFEFGSLFTVDYRDGSSEPAHRIALVGSHCSPNATLTLGAGVESFAIFLQPTALQRLLGVPTHHVADRSFPAVDVLGPGVDALWSVLAEAARLRGARPAGRDPPPAHAPRHRGDDDRPRRDGHLPRPRSPGGGGDGRAGLAERPSVRAAVRARAGYAAQAVRAYRPVPVRPRRQARRPGPVVARRRPRRRLLRPDAPGARLPQPQRGEPHPARGRAGGHPPAGAGRDRTRRTEREAHVERRAGAVPTLRGRGSHAPPWAGIPRGRGVFAPGGDAQARPRPRSLGSGPVEPGGGGRGR